MDEVIQRKKSKYSLSMVIIFGIVIVAIFYYRIQLPGSDSYAIDRKNIKLAQVELKTFENFIPLRASVVPSETYYIDTIEGGKVTDVFIGDGDMVELDTEILNLSNSTLQLRVIDSESEVSQLLSSISNLELVINNGELSFERNIIEYNFQVAKLEAVIKRQKKLKKDGYANESEIIDIEIELKYWYSMQNYEHRAQTRSKRLQQFQLQRLKSIYDVQVKNLDITKQNLDELIVKANSSGQISGFNVKKGQALKKGERIGQIDNISAFKLVSFLDEFYLEQTGLGQSVAVIIDGREIAHTISKVYPDVKNGQFRIELTKTDGSYQSEIRRGQSFQGKVLVSSTNSAMVIPNGSFFQASLGNWIFVFDSDSGVASKRKIIVGTKNQMEIQINDGLSEGEWVIISDYSILKNFEQIIINH